MKKFKKLSALLIAAIMVFAMAMPAMAAIEGTENAPEGDKAPLSVSGLNENDEVTFYQIMKITYNSDGQVMPEENWVVAETMPEGIDAKLRAGAADSEADINAIANAIKAGTLTPIASDKAVAKNGVATLADMNAGTFIAIVTKASKVIDPVYEKEITPTYNPIMLSSGYGEDGAFKTDGEDIAVGSKYGTDGTAKSSKPTVAKEITGGTEQDKDGGDDEYDEDEFSTPAATDGKKTASLGDVIDYEVRIVVPAYPEGAVNKSLWMTDTFDTGITFNGFGTVSINDDYEVTDTVKDGYNTIENADGEVVGWIKQTSNKTLGDRNTKDAIEIIFDYDVAKTLTSPLSIKYTGTLNKDAEIGRRPNLNTVEYCYTTNPNEGGTYKPGNGKPDKDFASEKDQEAVYTYKVALEKTDANGNPLAGAKFDLYDAEPTEENLADEKWVKAHRLAKDLESVEDTGLVEYDGLVKVGTYYFYETAAPTDYTLVEGTYVAVPANWSTATYTKYERSYTTEKPSDDAEVVGYILNGEFVAELDEEKWPEGAQAAYCIAETEELNEVSNPDKLVPAGIAQNSLMNSKTPVLPSTGGMGTYIFTIVGVALIGVAASLLIFKRRKDA